MIARTLIEALQDADPEAEVILLDSGEPVTLVAFRGYSEVALG